MGTTLCNIDATDDKRYLFNPAGETHTVPGYDWGVHITIWLSHYLGFTTGVHYQKYGAESDVANVRFADEDGVYRLKSRLDVAYLSVPLNLKIGHVFNNRHQVTLNFGPMVSQLAESELTWTVNNDEYDLSKVVDPWVTGRAYPFVSFEKFNLAFDVGAEYCFKIGSNGIGVSAYAYRSLRNLLKEGPSGEAYLNALHAQFVYRRYF
jgi:hypothetical protein